MNVHSDASHNPVQIQVESVTPPCLLFDNEMVLRSPLQNFPDPIHIWQESVSPPRLFFDDELEQGPSQISLIQFKSAENLSLPPDYFLMMKYHTLESRSLDGRIQQTMRQQINLRK